MLDQLESYDADPAPLIATAMNQNRVNNSKSINLAESKDLQLSSEQDDLLAGNIAQPHRLATQDMKVHIAETGTVRFDAVKQATQRMMTSFYTRPSDLHAQNRFSKQAVEMSKNACKITFKDICYTIQIPTSKDERKRGMGDYKPKKILDNCTGYFLPG